MVTQRQVFWLSVAILILTVWLAGLTLRVVS